MFVHAISVGAFTLNTYMVKCDCIYVSIFFSFVGRVKSLKGINNVNRIFNMDNLSQHLRWFWDVVDVFGLSSLPI
jgi:hypothetical protein